MGDTLRNFYHTDKSYEKILRKGSKVYFSYKEEAEKN